MRLLPEVGAAGGAAVAEFASCASPISIVVADSSPCDQNPLLAISRRAAAAMTSVRTRAGLHHPWLWVILAAIVDEHPIYTPAAVQD